MKIAAILDGNVESGGGFNQSLNAVLQMRNITKGEFDFVVITSLHANIGFLNHLGVEAVYGKPSIDDRLVALCSISIIGRKILQKAKYIGSWERFLLKQHVDLVYFLAPSLRPLSLQRLNYIFTVWDLCHRDTPEFPEVRECGQFLSRELTYNFCLAQAILVLTDSETLAGRIALRYGIDRERMLTLPFSPSPFLNYEGTEQNTVAFLQKYSLQAGYLFYPAQFWPHKNHIRILEALIILRNSGLDIQVVFCGSDQSNRGHIERFIHANGLAAQVRDLGFVPVEDMKLLYEHCHAVVMPTYFGPTNLPPLEAWMLGKPLIYSSHLKEQVGDAAICIDPDNADELADAMRLVVESDEVCNSLVERGYEQLRQVERERNVAEHELKSRLIQFEKRMRCWA